MRFMALLNNKLSLCLIVTCSMAIGQEVPPKLRSCLQTSRGQTLIQVAKQGRMPLQLDSDVDISHVTYPVRKYQMKLFSGRRLDSNHTVCDSGPHPCFPTKYTRCGEDVFKEQSADIRPDISELSKNMDMRSGVNGIADIPATSGSDLKCHDAREDERRQLMRADVDSMMDRLLSIKRMRADFG